MSTDLCGRCLRFVSNLLALEFDDWTDESGGRSGAKFFELGTVKGIEDRKALGCKICTAALSDWHELSGTGKSSTSTEVDCTKRQDVILHIRANPDPVKGMSPRFPPIVQCGPAAESALSSVEWDLFAADPATEPGVSCVPEVRRQSYDLPGPIRKVANEPEAVALAKRWVGECRLQHRFCQSFRDNPVSKTCLPTRVLDISRGDNTDPVLLVSNGRTGQYAALSHCWGTSKRLTLTKDRLEAFQINIPLKALPAVFRDAIYFARALEIPYLWIDCFGILQDDRKDWLSESHKMSEIYANSTVLLCAASVEDSSKTLFAERDPKWVGTEFEIPEYGRYGIRRRVREVEDEVFSAATHRRAWILQETILAPAVLYFTRRSLFWQCGERTASEAWPEQYQRASDYPAGISEVGFVITPTHVRFDEKVRATEIPFMVWCQLVREYTWRELSVPSDRLIAIEGLARKVGSVKGATYAYGLFLPDLHRGLLWHRGGELRGISVMHDFDTTLDYIAETKRLVGNVAPSWSWAAITGPVQYDWADSTRLAFIDRKKMAYEPEIRAHDDDARVLCVQGYLVKGHCAVRELTLDECVRFYPRQLEPAAAPGLSCIPDLDEDFNCRKCFLLPISAWTVDLLSAYDPYRRPDVAFYLILTKVSSSGAPRIYRRIGMGGDYLKKVENLFLGSEKLDLVLV